MIVLFHIFMLMFIVGSFVICIRRAFAMGQLYVRKRLIDEHMKKRQQNIKARMFEMYSETDTEEYDDDSDTGRD